LGRKFEVELFQSFKMFESEVFSAGVRHTEAQGCNEPAVPGFRFMVFFEFVDGLFVLSGVGIRDAESVMRFGQIRVKFQGLFVFCHRVRCGGSIAVSGGEIVMRKSEAGLSATAFLCSSIAFSGLPSRHKRSEICDGDG